MSRSGRWAVNLFTDEGDDDRRMAMSCWHTLMSKGYSLLATGSGRLPGTCTPASWTSKFTTSGCDADAEHDEMVNELQAMVLIGNEWANSADDRHTKADDFHPSDFEPEPATTQRVASEQCENENIMVLGEADDVTGNGPPPEKFENVEDNLQNLYSTVAKSAGGENSSLQPANSVVEPASPTCNRSELHPLSVYEDIWPHNEAVSSSNDTGGRQLSVDVLDDVEETDEVETTHAGHNDDEFSAPAIRKERVSKKHREVEERDIISADELVMTECPASDLQHHDDSNNNPQPRVLSSSRRAEPSDVAPPSRSSQLSETLRNNLERLLQRGPESARTGGGGRRRRSGRDAGQQRRDPTTSRDRKQQHRRHHHHHHRCHHHHQQQQQRHHHQHQGCELYSTQQDDVRSLISDNGTVRSLSTPSLSGISSNSEGIALRLYITIIHYNTVRKIA